MPLYKNGAFVEDAWRTVADDAAPGPEPSILSLKAWQALRQAHEGINVPIGIRIEPGEPVDAVLPALDRLALIELPFPKWVDGRSFSKASMLRGQHGFRGEIRASGDVLWDQLQLMRRCGFDAFLIDNDPTLKALAAGKPPFMDEFYQPGLGVETPTEAGRPWLRRLGR